MPRATRVNAPVLARIGRSCNVETINANIDKEKANIVLINAARKELDEKLVSYMRRKSGCATKKTRNAQLVI
nr:hypothetical protein [Moritella viscosa]SHO18144.1 Phosphate acetyltransferase [Moritella viscosa]